MRPVLKRALETALLGTGLGAIGRLRHRRRRLVLAYHNIVPTGAAPAADASLHLAQDRFARHLDLLRDQAEVLPLVDLLREGPGEVSDRPRVAITFDDAYQGALSAGLTELQRRGLPATVFVAPAFVGGHGFWWDELPEGDGAGQFRDRALRDWHGQDARIRQAVAVTGGRIVPAPAHARCVTESQLAAALDYPGLHLGSHTWSHPNLAALDEGALANELTRPREWLQRYGARVLPVISYPYGLSSPGVERAAAAAGYTHGLRVTGGWMPPPTGRATSYALPRLNVPAGLTPEGFRLRLAGWFCS